MTNIKIKEMFVCALNLSSTNAEEATKGIISDSCLWASTNAEEATKGIISDFMSTSKYKYSYLQNTLEKR